jgi:hypothetical protein
VAVRRRIRITLFLITAALCFSVACSNIHTSSSQTAQAALSIALKPAPSSTSVPVGSTTGIQFTPVVSNDPSNAGVDWAVTCPLSTPSSQNPLACGNLSISTLHSASGTTVSYLPPTTLQTGSLLVNVTVFATADHTKNVTTAVTVSTYASVLHGNYVLQVMGSDGNPYQATGVFAFDGKGDITSGQETINSSFSGFFSSEYTVQGASGTASTYFIGSDGRGTVTLNLQQVNTTNPLTQTFTLVMLSTSKALIAELDSSSASGTLELQDNTAAATMPTGAYAFVTSGTDSGSFINPNGSSLLPTAIGGVFNIDNNPSLGSISGNGSLADQDYYNSKGTKAALESCVPPTGVTGSVSAPSALGVVTITLKGATCFGITQPSTIQFTGYIVDATHIRLIESDDINGTGGFLTAGIAVSQGNSAATFTNASLSGSYVFAVLGEDVNALTPSSFTSAGVVNASLNPDGSGKLTGLTDTFFPGFGAIFTANALTGKYLVDSTLIGRAHLTPIFSGPSPKPTPTVLFYLTGNGTPPLVLWSEGEDPNSLLAIGAGIAYPQAANASTLSFGNPERYGLKFTQNSGGAEVDGSGEMTSTITGVTGTLSGTVDDTVNTLFSGGTPFPLLDTFALPADTFGRIGGTFLNLSGSSGPLVDYFLVNDNQGVLVETDFSSSSAVALGYFAQACDVTGATSCPAAAAGSSRRTSVSQARIRP